MNNRDAYNFIELQDLQPASHAFNPFNLTQASNSYKMTSGYAGGDVSPGDTSASAIRTEPYPHEQNERKRQPVQSFHELFEPISNPDPGGMADQQPGLLCVPVPRKRKSSSHGTSSVYDDNGEDTKSSRPATDRKQNHSEIEKRRRDKMNSYISELSSLVPMCGAMARKLDKLTVLRMAVRYLRSVTGALSSCPLTARPRPAVLTDKELNTLILYMVRDSFLLVVGCDRGRLLYLSQSASNILHYEQSELLGQSMFDILHPKDVAKVKEQLSSSDLSPRERLIDAKTMMPLKSEIATGTSRLCSGARRSFFCRIKSKASDMEQEVKEENAQTKMRKKHSQEKKYCVVQCTGYLKPWTPKDTEGRAEGAEDDACNMCLVAVMRALPDMAPPPVPAAANTRRIQFVSRHAIDGKFTFVDQRVTLVLGFLAQELLGTSLYEYVSGPELCTVARAHKAALFRCTPLRTPPYSFRCKDGSTVMLQTYFKPFRNPWTKDVEALVAQNTLLSDAEAINSTAGYCRESVIQGDPSRAGGSHDPSCILLENDVEVQRLIDSQVESHKIGSAIAEEALRRNSMEMSPDLPPELVQDAYGHQTLMVDNTVASEVFQVRNNVPLSAAVGESPPKDEDVCKSGGEIDEGQAHASHFDYPDLAVPLDCSEEPIDVIMSLLEADAGLGGPINFSGLPWPLP